MNQLTLLDVVELEHQLRNLRGVKAQETLEYVRSIGRPIFVDQTHGFEMADGSAETIFFTTGGGPGEHLNSIGTDLGKSSHERHGPLENYGNRLIPTIQKQRKRHGITAEVALSA